MDTFLWGDRLIKDERAKEFKDSKTHLTKHMTGSQYDLLPERTEINSAEELRYGHFNTTLARFLWEGFGIAPDAYFEYKISKDRGSRTEDVEVLKGMYLDERSLHTGIRLAELEDEMKTQEKESKRRF